ncbi:MAG TPA: VWA domain-containing protein [Nocardioidaceae bacterium]|nr:VWA domain-containing protein [Nocardioidaceae bacterium]
MASCQPDHKPPAGVDLLLAGFARALRHAGVAVTSDRTQSFLRAASVAEAGAAGSVYWAGRATLCSGPDDFPLYDRVFASWFGGELPTGSRRRTPVSRVVEAGLGSDGDEAEGGEEAVAAVASDVEVLRHRDVAELATTERAELARMFAALRPRPPLRRAARRVASPRGEIDARRTLRDELRYAGEPGRVRYRRRGRRARRVVLLVDVSGSMSPYADSLLRLAHAVTRAAPRSTEVFTVGTRLTRITRAMRQRDPDTALTQAGATVPDWSGGTRLGEVLKAFLDRWGQRGMARGAVVVVCSDGWERGDSGLLGAQVQRLSRLAHRLVWVNPHRGKAGYEPVQAGIAACLPHLDDFLAGHSFATFAELTEVMADA